MTRGEPATSLDKKPNSEATQVMACRPTGRPSQPNTVCLSADEPHPIENNSVKSHAAEHSSDDAHIGAICDMYSASIRGTRDPAHVDALLHDVLSRYPQYGERLQSALEAMRRLVMIDGGVQVPRVGGLFAGFRVMGVLGQGGMGTVYLAHEVDTDRLVALKVLMRLGEAASKFETAKLRFQNEVRACAALSHPHIVPIYSYRQVDGAHCFAMQLIEGGDWTLWMRQLAETNDRPQHWREIALAVKKIAEAMRHAHACGVIHRDIKPSNLLRNQAGEVWITDFGLARGARLNELTMTGELVGTLRYMSPEQASGKHVRLDERSDMYSLGITFCEMLTGAAVIDGDSHSDQLRTILAGVESKISSLLHGWPRDLVTVVLKMTALAPEDRYDSMDSLINDLRRLLNAEPIQARRLALHQRFKRWGRERAGWLLALVGLLTLSAGGLTFLALHLNSTQRLAKQQQQRAEASSAVAEQSRRDAQRYLLDAKLAFARLNVVSKRPGQGEQTLQAIAEARKLAEDLGVLGQQALELRNLAILALSRVDVALRTREPIASGYRQAATISRDGSTLAIPVRQAGEARGHITVRFLDAPKRPQLRIPIPWDTRRNYHDEVLLKLSPNGGYLWFTLGFEHGFLWDLTEDRLVSEIRAELLFSTAFSADSSHLCVVQHSADSSDDRVQFIELTTGQVAREISSVAVSAVQLSADGRRLAIGSDKFITLIDMDSGATLSRRAHGRLPVDQLAWSAGQSLLATAHASEICVWDVEQFQPGKDESSNSTQTELGAAAGKLSPTGRGFSLRHVLRGHQAQVSSLDFHPQLEYLLTSGSWDRTSRLWNVHAGAEQLMIEGTDPIFSSDGTSLAVAESQGLGFYTLATGAACRWLRGEGASQATFAADSHSLVLGEQEEPLSIFRFPQWREEKLTQLAHSVVVSWDTKTSGFMVEDAQGLSSIVGLEHTGRREQTLQQCVLEASNRPLAYCRLSESGRWVIAQYYDSWSPILIDRSTNRVQRMATQQRTCAAALSDDERWLALSFTDRCCVYSLPDMQLQATLPCDTRSIPCFSPDSRTLLVVDNDVSRGFSVPDWSLKFSYAPAEHCRQMAVSSDSRWAFAPQSLGSVAMLDMIAGTPLACFELSDLPVLTSCVQLSPDQRWLFIANESRGSVLWDLQYVAQALQGLELSWPR